MASARDAQDILDLKQTDAAARPKKKGPKPKLVRPAHIPKEVWLLETQGDRAPPVALTAVAPKKPKFTRRVKPYELQSFTHPNRTDGLVLRHWARKPIVAESPANGPVTPAEGVPPGSAEARLTQAEPRVASHWAKYNVKVDVPKYTDAQYEKNLESADWSKEETDYLMQLVEDLDLRWVVIADRYDYHPLPPANGDGGDGMALAAVAKPRTMEALKARYYKIASTMMAINQPLSSMTPAEFALHEKMTKFDPVKEGRRKKMAEQLLLRTDEEIEEEKRLLAELKRIIQDEDDFIQERTELYERLNAPQGRGNISMHETSMGLIQLLQQLQAQDKAGRSKQQALQQAQRRQIAGIEERKEGGNTPATPSLPSARASDLRKSMDGHSDKRRDSKAGQPSFVQRQLSEREQRKYGVSRPEKLLTGEKIRHVRIERRVTARASSVAAKVQDSMVELGIPIKPVMATAKITEGYEDLCAKLDLLLDTRRISEKVENEIKVLRAQKDAREGVKGPDDKANEGDPGKAEATGQSGGMVDNDTDEQMKDDNQQEENEEIVEIDDGDRDDEEREGQGEQLDEEEEEGEEEDKAEADADADADADAEEDEDGDEAAKSDSDNEAVAEDDVDIDDDDDDDGGGGGGEDDEEESAAEDAEDAEVDEAEADEAEDDAAEDEGEREDEEESRPSTRASGRSGRKRSVSVLSSAPSHKSSKRQRK